MRYFSLISVGLLAAVLTPSAHAYETDQLTGRLTPLQDAMPQANAWANELIAGAVARANAQTRCKQDLPTTRRILGRRIADATASGQYVPERKLAGFGYGVFAALLETGPVDRHSFLDRSDIYGALKPGEAVVLYTVGTCSTIRMGNVLMGTDKLDHFWELGFQYAGASRWGSKPERAWRWGTFTEKLFYGLLTSDVFSYADLRANESGYRFYVELLSPTSTVQLGEDGCVKQVRPFDFAEWVDDDYDEVLNPSVYNRFVQRGVAERLAARKDEYCASYVRWRDGYLPILADKLEEDPPYAGKRAPRHDDMYDLEQLCAPEIAAALASGVTRTPGPVDLTGLRALYDGGAPRGGGRLSPEKMSTP